MRGNAALCLFAAFALSMGAARPAAASDTRILTSTAPAPIRSEPPGLFTGKGEQLGVATPGERYRVLSRKLLPSIAGKQEWLLIQPVDPRDSASGWVYGGDGRDLSNFSAE